MTVTTNKLRKVQKEEAFARQMLILSLLKAYMAAKGLVLSDDNTEGQFGIIGAYGDIGVIGQYPANSHIAIVLDREKGRYFGDITVSTADDYMFTLRPAESTWRFDWFLYNEDLENPEALIELADAIAATSPKLATALREQKRVKGLATDEVISLLDAHIKLFFGR